MYVKDVPTKVCFNHETIKPIPNRRPFMFLTNRMDIVGASSFCALLSRLKSPCIVLFYFLPALSLLILKAPHATPENTTSLDWNLGWVPVVYVGYFVCSVALRNKRRNTLRQVFVL